VLPRVAWGLAGLTLVLVVLDVTVSAQAVALTSETAVAVHGFPFVHGAVLGSSVMGAVIVSRLERNPIGWLLVAVGTTTAFSLAAEAYAYWVQEAGGPGATALGGAASWLSALVGGQLAISAMALMFLLVPDGHFLSPRWRYAAWVTGLGELLCLVAVASASPTAFRLETHSEVSDPARATMLSIGFVLISCGLVASVVCMVQRLRRSSGEQRRQLRVIALAAALIAVGLVFLLVVQGINGGEQTWLAGVPLFVAYFLLPILIAVAVLRYRLYDVELIINRTVLVVLGAGFAAIGYTTLVVAVGNLVDRRTSGLWLSLLATVVVALAFQPLRRWVVRLADRLAYGSRAQPYQELSDFSDRLGSTLSPGSLLATVAAVAGQAVAAQRVTATLDVPTADVPPAVWGSAALDGAETHEVTVGDDGVALGRLEVTLPRGRRLRPGDARRLQTLADQAAVAFRNTALELQLAARVAELDRTASELARARVRIIEADDAVRRELEAAISREVVPHLVAVADGLGTVGIGALVDDVNRALEALRELTRGVFPTQLARSGLEAALRSVLARRGQQATLTVHPSATGLRFDPRVETAVYLCCAAAVRRAPGPTDVALRVDGGTLDLRVAVVGPDRLDLQGIEDRMNAVGGVLVAEEDGLTLRVPDAVREPVLS
jgi:hypothetical protein